MGGAAPLVPSRIFISYRRGDSIAHVNGLFPLLRERFGDDSVFKDTHDIAPGQDFVAAIEEQLRSCSVLLAVIGQRWLSAGSPRADARRLDDPEDYVRFELATALQDKHVLVIPILVDGAKMQGRICRPIWLH